MRLVANEGEIEALVAGGFENGEVGVVGKLLVDRVKNGTGRRVFGTPGEQAGRPCIRRSGLKHQAGAGSAARFKVYYGADLLGPGVFFHKSAGTEKSRFFAVVN